MGFLDSGGANNVCSDMYGGDIVHLLFDVLGFAFFTLLSSFLEEFVVRRFFFLLVLVFVLPGEFLVKLMTVINLSINATL
jgi:hypothetical protein